MRNLFNTPASAPITLASLGASASAAGVTPANSNGTTTTTDDKNPGESVTPKQVNLWLGLSVGGSAVSATGLYFGVKQQGGLGFWAFLAGGGLAGYGWYKWYKLKQQAAAIAPQEWQTV